MRSKLTGVLALLVCTALAAPATATVTLKPAGKKVGEGKGNLKGRGDWWGKRHGLGNPSGRVEQFNRAHGLGKGKRSAKR